MTPYSMLGSLVPNRSVNADGQSRPAAAPRRSLVAVTSDVSLHVRLSRVPNAFHFSVAKGERLRHRPGEMSKLWRA
jgi:hypothetical protein